MAFCVLYVYLGHDRVVALSCFSEKVTAILRSGAELLRRGILNRKKNRCTTVSLSQHMSIYMPGIHNTALVGNVRTVYSC